MDSDGHRGNSNSAAMLAALISKRDRFQEELRSIEKQVFELETSYLQEASHFGNVLKGFEGFLSSTKNTSNLKRPRKLQPEDRLFSLSSVTSPVAEELGFGRDDGRSDYGLGRSKGGALPSNGQGKPKKGRTTVVLRDGKRNRQSNEPDFDDEDDPDMNLR